jgi:hypothetical protein
LTTSRPHGRRLDCQATRPFHEIEFQVDEFGRAEGEGLGSHPDHAVAQTPLQRSDRLPLQPIERIAGRMRLRNDAAAKPLAPVFVMAGRAGEIELTDAAPEEAP